MLTASRAALIASAEISHVHLVTCLIYDIGVAMVQLDKLLDFNRKLDELSHDEAAVPGLGRTSVWGGKYDSSSGEGRTRDLHSLFRIFLEEKLRQRGAPHGALFHCCSAFLIQAVTPTA